MHEQKRTVDGVVIDTHTRIDHPQIIIDDPSYGAGVPQSATKLGVMARTHDADFTGEVIAADAKHDHNAIGPGDAMRTKGIAPDGTPIASKRYRFQRSESASSASESKMARRMRRNAVRGRRWR